MAVIVQYIVERNGTQKMTFADKKQAEEYDKQLEISENLFALLQTAGVGVSEDQLDEIAFFLAKNKDDAVSILKGVKAKPASEEKEEKSKAPKAKTDAKKPDPKTPETKTQSEESAKAKTAAA